MENRSGKYRIEPPSCLFGGSKASFWTLGRSKEKKKKGKGENRVSGKEDRENLDIGEKRGKKNMSTADRSGS